MWARYERRSRHQRYDRMGLACSVGEGRTGASRISGLCANFHPCRASPQPHSPLFLAFLVGVAQNRRRISTPSNSAFGVMLSTRSRALAGSSWPARPPPLGCAGCGFRAARGSATLIAGPGAGRRRGGCHPCCPARCVGQERCLLARSAPCYAAFSAAIARGRFTDGTSPGLPTLGYKGKV